jgi:hypothetical protein
VFFVSSNAAYILFSNVLSVLLRWHLLL